MVREESFKSSRAMLSLEFLRDHAPMQATYAAFAMYTLELPNIHDMLKVSARPIPPQ